MASPFLRTVGKFFSSWWLPWRHDGSRLPGHDQSHRSRRRTALMVMAIILFMGKVSGRI